MIKRFVFSATILLLFCRYGYPQIPMTLNFDVPKSVEAGQEFDVKLTINKGDLEEFSRFQQELPAGLNATVVNSESSDFSFDNQRVRFIWLKLPQQDQINVVYRIKVNQRLKGNFSLEGEFSYVENEERKSLTVKSGQISITPSPYVTENQQVDVLKFAEVLDTEKKAVESKYEITCIRQTPYKTSTGSDYIVRILVYKKDMNKFAKIEEQIPDGFEARSMDSKDGIFTFKDGIAKFVWMNLPITPGFVISYRLLPVGNRTTDELNITGQLSYIDMGRNITIDITQENVDLSQFDENNVEQFLADLEKGEVSPVPETKELMSETETGNKTGKKPITKTEKETDTRPVEKPLSKEPPKSKYSDIPPTRLLPVEPGIYFRVQLAAAHVLVDPVSTYKKYNFERPVKIEYHDGWYKYSIGSFTSYDEATSFREMVVSHKKISGAFVVAYQNGQRITVPEAIKNAGNR